MKACNVYWLPDRILIVGMDETDAKFYKLVGPVVKLEFHASQNSIGQAVLAAAANSKQGTPAQSLGERIVPSILRQAGLKSWKEFSLYSRECLVEVRAGRVRLTPAIRSGDGAALHQCDQIVETDSSPEQLGSELFALLSRPLQQLD
jgi:hypothetical protein